MYLQTACEVVKKAIFGRDLVHVRKPAEHYFCEWLGMSCRIQKPQRESDVTSAIRRTNADRFIFGRNYVQAASECVLSARLCRCSSDTKRMQRKARSLLSCLCPDVGSVLLEIA